MFCYRREFTSVTKRAPSWSNISVGHMQRLLVYWTSPWSYCLPPVDGQHGQEGRPCRCNVPMLQEICKLWAWKHNNACLHPPHLHGYKLTEHKQGDIIWLYTFFTNPFKKWRASLACPCMAHPPSMAIQETTSHDGILLNTLQTSSRLPHFAYMWTKLFPVQRHL